VGAEEFRVSLEPEIGDRLAEEMARVRPCFPLRRAKIQRPYLPEETLPRDRLFSWLEARANRRLVYVVAEAGFGKTTLVADFLNRSQLRTFWYRLDEDDTDSLVFVRYLVAACQAVDAGLLVRTGSLLEESAAEPTPVEIVTETLLAEAGKIGRASCRERV
jgi:LuxR family transcriptional regulator, maltose regulon positive regulatory protein